LNSRFEVVTGTQTVTSEKISESAIDFSNVFLNSVVSSKV
jgi:hypothetical protein